MSDTAVILLSGGLDSVVSLAKSLEKYDIKLALFFNYGQKSFEMEKKSVINICGFYGIKYQIIDLPWLKMITKTSLVNKNSIIPGLTDENLEDTAYITNSMKNVWIPNRNGVFLNIAASYCDSLEYNNIIIGANAEEAATFIDNSEHFIYSSNKLFEYSTLIKPKVIAPLINLDKKAIILLGNQLNIPFKYIRSCYSDNEKHCGVCESCVRLKRGLESAGLFDILNMLFVK